MKKSVLFVLVVMAIAFSSGMAIPAEKVNITLEIRDLTLGETLGQISKISGYTIYLQPEWRSLPVTVNLLNLTLEQAVAKLLDKRINYAIIWNDQEKNISITGVEISQKKQGTSGNIRQPRVISGQGVRFEQGSRTILY